MDRVSKIISYESGTMSDEDAVLFFQELINDGSAWTLQGHYGRTAKAFIEEGLCKMKSDKNDQGKELVTKGILNLHVTYVGPDAHKRTVHHLLQSLVENAESRGTLSGGFDMTVEEITFDIKFEDQEKKEEEQ